MAKIIPLTRGYETIVDDEDYELVQGYVWYPTLLRTRKNTYPKVYAITKRPAVKMHRLIMKVSDNNLWVDHVDYNGLNNCKSNLRIVTPQQNAANRRMTSGTVTGYKGVQPNYRGVKFNARIKVRGVVICLGSFNSKELAARAYDEAAEHYFGEFAYLNFPEDKK